MEDELASWYQYHVPAARVLSFCTGYMANLAVISALGDAQATLFSDALNHASLIDGCRLARAAVQRYACYKKLRLTVRPGIAGGQERIREELAGFGGEWQNETLEWIIAEGNPQEQVLLQQVRILSEAGVADYYLEKPTLQEVIRNAFA